MKAEEKPENCMWCGACEEQCPQKINIREDLVKVTELLQSLWEISPQETEKALSQCFFRFMRDFIWRKGIFRVLYVLFETDIYGFPKFIARKEG